MGILKNLFSSDPKQAKTVAKKINIIFNHFSYLLRKEKPDTIKKFLFEPVNLSIINTLVSIGYNQIDGNNNMNSFWTENEMTKKDASGRHTPYGFTNLVFSRLKIKRISVDAMWREYCYWRVDNERDKFLHNWGVGLGMIIYEIEVADYGWDSDYLDGLFNRHLEFINSEGYINYKIRVLSI